MFDVEGLVYNVTEIVPDDYHVVCIGLTPKIYVVYALQCELLQMYSLLFVEQSYHVYTTFHEQKINERKLPEDVRWYRL